MYHSTFAIDATSSLWTQAQEIHDYDIKWEPYLQSHLISEDIFAFIVAFESAILEERETLIHYNRELCGQAFIIFLENAENTEIVQYVLVLIQDMLMENNSNVEVFNYWSLISKRPILEPFFNLLLHSDGFIVHMSAVIISEIIAWNEVLMDSYDLHLYLKWIETELNKEKNPYLQSVIRCLQLLLRKNEYRIVFVIKDGISQILKVLQQQNNFQIEYQLIFCIWLLTFIPEIAEEEIMFSSVIPILIGTLNDTSKEKVIRIILAVLRNLISKPADTMVVRNHCIKMVKCKILKKLDILEKQDYKDEDIIEDLIFLIQQLKAAVHYLSSFDMYKAELTCGELEWTPVHKSTSFWEDNACRLNENCYELIQILINLLKSSTNPTVLSVACFDIGQYVQYCPNGKRVIEELDGKHIVMNLLEHENQHVRYEALVAVQKIMIQNWECLVKMMENDEPEKSEVEKMNQII